MTNTKTATRIEVIYEHTLGNPGWYVRILYTHAGDVIEIGQPVTARRNARIRALRPLVREVAQWEGVKIPRGLAIEVHAA